ncbi:MAG: hypothetical protein JRI38_06315, partial [Deltaproteobacteria bacterium]|nr:hypothetical protein [Deltaproteobacteria bacterium]
TVSRFNNWMQFAVIVFAFLTAISGFLVWLSGNKISLQQTNAAALAQQNIKLYENTSLSVHKELVTLQQKQFETEQLLKVANTNLSRLRNQLKKAQKNQSEAEQALDQMKIGKDRIVHETKIPATPKKPALFSKFSEQFLDIMKQNSEGIIDIYAVQGDSASNKLAVEFDTLFKKAGWTTNGVAQSTFSQKIEGIVLAFNSKDTAPSYASFLLHAFTKLGIAVSTRVNSKYPEWSLSLIVSDFPGPASNIKQNSP